MRSVAGRFKSRFWHVVALNLFCAAFISGCTGDRSTPGAAGELRTIRIDTIAHLDFAGLPQAPDAPSRVFATPDGRWAVSSEVFGGTIQFFNQAGEPAGSFSKSGAGPGELGGQVFGTSSNGRLVVLDPANARLTVFDSRMLVQSSRPVEGRVFSMSSSADRESIVATGFFDGNSVGEFGVPGQPDRFAGSLSGNTAREQIRYGAVASTGDLWTVGMAAADLQIWNSELRSPAALALTVAPSSNGAPPPTALGVTADSAGIIYVIIAVPDAEWSDDLDDDVDGIESMFDTLILAYDGASRSELARSRLDEVCIPVEGGALSCVLEALESIRLLSLRLQ